MFEIKRIILIVISLFLLAVFFGCKSINKDNVNVQNGEIVVIQDKSDTVIGAYNIDTLNPISTNSKSTQRIMNIVYESLFSLSEDLSIEPVLAESYVLSDAGNSITVFLKKNVKWENGTLFTADDVCYTLDKITSSNGMYRNISEKIQSYSALDNHSVIIDFKRPESDFAYLLTFPIISSATTFDTGDGFVPMGTGSYKLKSRTSTELYFEPNQYWHGGHISEKKVTVKILKDELTATNALNVKEIDAVALESYNQDTNIPNLNATSKTITTNNMVFLGFNVQSPVMSGNVRRAITAIIDKQKILENYAYGKGKIATLSVNPTSWASKFPETEKLDADDIMYNDGYKMDNGVYVKDDLSFSCSLLVNSENPQKMEIAQGICDMLNLAGLKTAIDAVPYKDYVSKINTDQFDMFIGEVEVSHIINPSAMLENEDNYFNFDTSFLNETASSLYGVYERDKIKEILSIYKTRFYQNPPYLPLFYKNDIIIYGEYVSGIEVPNIFDAFKGLEKWFFYDKNGDEKNTQKN